MAKLVVRKGRNSGSEYKLNADRLVMGRRSACPIPILDPKSSREHAAVLKKDGHFYVLDMSRNGTYVNNKNASKDADSPTPLNFGDQIRIGETVLEMVDEKSETFNIDIPGYKIGEKIGMGGMGTVYKAKQLSMDRVVALKLLNEKYSANREFVDRFIREARAAGKLNHPNVIHVHDVSKAGGRHYFSMEYIDGNSVKEMLRINGKIKPEQSVDIVLQAAKALEFAHECGIIHRDIKPDNIMLTTEGVVKIADLGIAKMWEEELSDSHDNRKVMGTPHYMAPEQALGKDIDFRVDVYALGATVYHMLTGTTPFSGNTAHAVLKAHIKDSLRPIQEYESTVPDPLCFIIERMMAKLPEKRYLNMTRLIEDLERVRSGLEDGIERIPAGDSTILRAMNAKEAAAVQQIDETGDARTGIQTPIATVFLYSVLAGGLIVLAAAGLFHLWKKGQPSKQDQIEDVRGIEKPDDDSGKPDNDGPPEDDTANEDAVAEQLAEARKILKNDPISAQAERILQNLVSSFPTLSDEAKELLSGIGATRKAGVRVQAKLIFDKARQFEDEHKNDTEKMAEIAKNWQSILSRIQGVEDLFKTAEARAKSWQNKYQAERDRSLESALQTALTTSKQAIRAKDYNAARKALTDFIARYAGAEQKKKAEELLTSVNTDATAAFQAAVDAVKAKQIPGAPMVIPGALGVWRTYLDDVKDDVTKSKVDAAILALEGQAKQIATTEEEKIKKMLHAFQFADALILINKLKQNLKGTEVLPILLKRSEAIELQRDLHAEVLQKLSVKLKAGPVAAPFKMVFRAFEHIEAWQITRIDSEKVDFTAVENPGLGKSKKFGEFSGLEQYTLYQLAFPKPSKDEREALLEFCKERALLPQIAELEKALTETPKDVQDVEKKMP